MTLCEKYVQLGTLNRGSATFISLQKPLPSTRDIGFKSSTMKLPTACTNCLCQVKAVSSGVTLQKPSEMERPSFEGA